MQNLRTLEITQLVDLLHHETTRYYKMAKDRISKKEEMECKMMIQEIQKEINQRKKVTR